ncbi:MAG: hypothetical protein IPH43_13620 [Xanthomonadales bacterium]|nr:hypothetical protein [Xanthomonadales bacterium]
MIKDNNQDGIPDTVADSGAELFGQGNFGVVDLTRGPGDDVFFVDINNGRVGRISWDTNPAQRNLAPSAAITLEAGSTADGPPRTIAFSAANSIDPEAGALSYAWDLDGDGDFDDAGSGTASASYSASTAQPVRIQVGVRASDSAGASDTARMTVVVLRDALFSDSFDPALAQAAAN